MEDYSQEDWGNHSQELHGYPTDQELDEMPVSKRTLKIKQESSEEAQKRDTMQNIVQILESVQLKWELFQSWTDFSRLHLSNKLAIFGIGYNTRWKEDIRYHYAEISSQVPLGKRLREYFNSEKPEGRIIYCYLGIAEVRTLQQCLFLHFQANAKTFSKEWVGINGFLSQNCIVDPGVSPKSIYIKFVEVERDFLSAGSLVECLEKAIGYPLKFNN